MDKIWLQRYQPGVPETINPDLYVSLVALFEAKCTQFKDRPALSNFGCQLTYQEFYDLSQAFAAYLQQKLGCVKGERIAIMLPNSLQYPIALFGSLMAGLIVTNVNPLYTVPEFIHQINDAGAETIIVMTNFAHVVQAALPQTGLKNIIVTELGDLFSPLKAFAVNVAVKYIKHAVPAWHIPNTITFKSVLTAGRQLTLTPVAIAKNDLALLQYTGGTTGVAKGAQLTHRNILANVAQVIAWVKPLINDEKPEVGITPLPLYHIFSLTANCFCFLALGALNVLITDPRNIQYLVRTMAKAPFSLITGVNTLFNALLNNPNFAKLDFSHLKVALGGGAAVQRSVAEQWRKVTGKVLLEGYGLTEASPVVCVMPMDIVDYNDSIGLPLPSTEIMLCDQNNQEVLTGEPGELCIKGPQVMQAYWQQPEETAHIFTPDGWLKTGDIARMDKDGFLYIVDRKKDMILVSGFNVYPNEVEEVIASHPGVLEVAVVGVPNSHSGETVKAFVVKKDPLLTADALLAFCRQHLTGYKLPKYIEFRDSLPKSPVGKILRRMLRDA